MKKYLIALIMAGCLAIVLTACQSSVNDQSTTTPPPTTIPVYPDTGEAPELSLIWKDADNTMSGSDIYDHGSRLEIHPFAHRWSEGSLYSGSYNPYPEEIEIYFKSDSYFIPIYACAAGIVTEVVNNVTEYGQQIGVVEDYDVTVRYGKKYLLFYAHIASIEVAVAQQIEKGEKIGYVLPLNDYPAGYYELGVGQRTGENSGRYCNPYTFFDANGKEQLSELWTYVTSMAASRGTDYISWDLVDGITLSANARDSTMSDKIKTVFTSGEFPEDISYWDSSYWTFLNTFQDIDW